MYQLKFSQLSTISVSYSGREIASSNRSLGKFSNCLSSTLSHRENLSFFFTEKMYRWPLDRAHIIVPVNWSAVNPAGILDGSFSKDGAIFMGYVDLDILKMELNGSLSDHSRDQRFPL